DSRAEGQTLKTIKIKQFSNAHFKLLAALPELGRYQRLGNMTVVVNNQSLIIGPDGKDDLTATEIKAIVGS
ncbi:MAG TPA: hypothetical protein VFI02_20010, partial [Armatimonadota bacterium]|nr:hypothetical protein [Armatimonadota bacterium]